MRKDDPDAALADFLEGLTDRQKKILIPVLKECVIPLVTELLPTLERNHNLKFYQSFFTDLDVLIKSGQAINQQELEEKLVHALLHMITEIERYKPAVHAILQLVWETEMPMTDSTSSRGSSPQIEEDLD